MNITKITFLFLILISIQFNVYSQKTINYEKKGFEYFIKWLDTNKVFNGDTSILFDKNQNRIFVAPSTYVYAISTELWKSFIAIDSNGNDISQKLLGKYVSEKKIFPITSTEKFVKLDTKSNRVKYKKDGDMYAIVCNRIKIGKFIYVIVEYDFGNWWSFDFAMKFNTKGQILAYDKRSGVN